MDRLFRTNITQAGFSYINAGNNRLPDWVVNQPIGSTQLGTPYWDSVIFKLDNNYVTSEFINTMIAIVNTAKVTKSLIRGRKGGSVKQFINQDDYDITFNIKVIAPHGLPSNGIIEGSIQKVGIGNQSKPPQRFGSKLIKYPFDGVNPVTAANTINNTLEQLQTPAIAYQGDYLPNDEIYRLFEFLNVFYEDNTYTNVKVISKYLNDNFGIDSIIPYSITTQQGESTNTYNVIIKAYSDFSSNLSDEFESEITP